MNKELKYSIGDKVSVPRLYKGVKGEIIQMSTSGTDFPYLIGFYTPSGDYCTSWEKEESLKVVPFKIADLFNLYKTPSNRERRFKAPFDKTIYYDGEDINVSSTDWLSPEDITDIYTSFDMMDIEVIEIKEVQKEMTIEEIEKELGYKVKVVGD